jgi:mannose-6-phosphate isomerase-like protein (cupin superfamily)
VLVGAIEFSVVTTSVPGDFLVVDREALPESELQGINFGGAGVCLIFVDMEPGDGPRLHRHPYEEVFLVLGGRSLFVIGSETVEAKAGQIVIVRPRVAHKFTNVGTGRLQQIDIHVSPEFVTEWLE